MTHTLSHQYEGETQQVLGKDMTFGATMYVEDDGSFTYRLHAKQYDGIKVVSKYDTDYVKIEAQTRAEAWRAVGQALRSFEKIYTEETD